MFVITQGYLDDSFIAQGYEPAASPVIVSVIMIWGWPSTNIIIGEQ